MDDKERCHQGTWWKLGRFAWGHVGCSASSYTSDVPVHASSVQSLCAEEGLCSLDSSTLPSIDPVYHKAESNNSSGRTWASMLSTLYRNTYGSSKKNRQNPPIYSPQSSGNGASPSATDTLMYNVDHVPTGKHVGLPSGMCFGYRMLIEQLQYNISDNGLKKEGGGENGEIMVIIWHRMNVTSAVCCVSIFVIMEVRKNTPY
ncbi:hypothetical protein [Anaplasma platys]|nr:hypothetical protein [Anaplasma platys]